MLRELHIHNLAVIEDARMSFAPGLNCFTGQTGAGKSLIMGAFEILLGLRPASAQMLRPGAREARVAGVFELQSQQAAAEIGFLLDQSLQAGDELLVSRRILASGRSSLSVNAQPCTAAMLREVGQRLVDIHGQHDQQYLLKPANQLMLLDAFAGATELRLEVEKFQKQHRSLQQRREELAASRTLRQQQLDLYEHQAAELAGASLEEGEYQTLKQRHVTLTNIQRIASQAAGVAQALDEGEDPINPRLGALAQTMAQLAELDPELSPMARQLRDAAVMLEDVSFDLARHAGQLEMDPEEYERVEARLNLLNRLVARYAHSGRPDEDAITQVIAYHQQIDQLIRQLRNEDEDSATIDRQLQQTTDRLLKTGAQLLARRQAGAKKLRPLVEAQLHELGMNHAQFDFEFNDAPAMPVEDGTTEEDHAADHLSGHLSDHGGQMVIRTNPGQPMLPLRKIASGGEMSRIMLALKAILAQADRVSVLVFDEIDSNIGGRMGDVIGRKLRALAHEANHQVLCITHLPQIAAFADRHLHITKHAVGSGQQGHTSTTVHELQGDQRIEELAQMLAGSQVTRTTKVQIREMLAGAH